jgi:hypothetical protein
VRASKKKSFERFGFGTCGLSVAVCEREWSEACSLLYFFPLDEEKKKINYR